MTDLLKVTAIRERINRGNCTGDEKWLLDQVERLSRIEAAAVAYRDTYRRYDLTAESGTPLEWAEAGSDESDAKAALFATLPSSEETSRG